MRKDSGKTVGSATYTPSTRSHAHRLSIPEAGETVVGSFDAAARGGSGTPRHGAQYVVSVAAIFGDGGPERRLPFP